MQSLSSSDLQQYINWIPLVVVFSLKRKQSWFSLCWQYWLQLYPILFTSNPLFNGQTSQGGLGLKWRPYQEGVGWCSFIYLKPSWQYIFELMVYIPPL